MRVLLISANTETINMVSLPLGPACVAAATKQAGHDVMFLDLLFEAEAGPAIRHAVEQFQPDLIGLSIRNIDDQNMQEGKFLLASLKAVMADCREASRAPVVLGGAGYSIFPESCLRYLGADFGIQGEGEVVLPALLDRMERGASWSDLPGVYQPGCAPARRSFAGDLDSLPLPEPGLWVPPHTNGADLWIPVQTRRGCPLDCSYCSTAEIEGRLLRARSPEKVVSWLARFARAGYRNFNFVDNTFNLPREYAAELCRCIIHAEMEINWWCIVYPKWVDHGLVELMAQAGCRQISLGFETGSGHMLRSLNKQFSPDEVRAISDMFLNAGVERRGFLLLGGPGETKESVEESLAFADGMELDYLKVTVGLRIYPHTQLARAAIAEGVAGEEEDLLLPRYYLTPELREWLPARAAAYRTARPWVV